jgi:hypothetical protein
MTKKAAIVRGAAAAAFCVVLGFVACEVGTAGSGRQVNDTPTVSAIQRVHVAVDAAREGDPIPDSLRPALDDLHASLADVGDCDYSHGLHRLCRRGFVKGDKTMVVLGDSHARALIPAFQPLAKRAGYAAYYLVKQGCTAARVTPDHGSGGFANCSRWRQWAIDTIQRLRPRLLVITGALPDGLAAPDGRRVTDPATVAARTRVGLVSTIRAVRRYVGRVYVVSDAPGLADDPAVCLAAAGADLGSCASAPSAAAGLHFAADRAAARRTGISFVDARAWFCWQDLCPAVVGSTVTYRDGGHVTTVYARSLSRSLQDALHLMSRQP